MVSSQSMQDTTGCTDPRIHHGMSFSRRSDETAGHRGIDVPLHLVLAISDRIRRAPNSHGALDLGVRFRASHVFGRRVLSTIEAG